MVYCLRNAEIKAALAQRKPYQEWLDTNLVRLTDIHQQPAHFTKDLLDGDTLFNLQQLFGYTHEDVELDFAINVDRKQRTNMEYG